MGRLNLIEMIEFGSLRMALRWHFESNLWPRPPDAMVPVAENAIRLVADGYGGTVLGLPDGRSAVTADALVEALHLHEFVDAMAAIDE